MSQSFGLKISYLAKLRGFTQERIAKESKISRASVNRFFKCRTDVKSSDFSAILNVLNINLEEFINHEIQKTIGSMRGADGFSSEALPSGIK